MNKYLKTIILITSIMIAFTMLFNIHTKATETSREIIEVDIGILFNQSSGGDIATPVYITDYSSWNNTDYYNISSIKINGESSPHYGGIDVGDNLNIEIVLTSKSSYVFNTAVLGKINGIIVEVENKSETEILLEWNYILEKNMPNRPSSPVNPILAPLPTPTPTPEADITVNVEINYEELIQALSNQNEIIQEQNAINNHNTEIIIALILILIGATVGVSAVMMWKPTR